ncbi:hypothetical protein SDRG_08568 [Saprolegnia diclina VS20]|uniref:Uncharacterized protein n=1 Tax=Saprolegnia diclina (strain VS20) TaxID=1156394 RepID=T0RU15_SAPDV|nr:hypothetical protein SDRG_08568 [Saprolegnia diclina VS20]EQC33887.1 hypothetical protein SDRG_08568 [Saprolegnia diclina VS20]|eukprot:XP_008612682.1 hypothetical protein SDRG_08568 [Saprolegnia diclina VS20]
MATTFTSAVLGQPDIAAIVFAFQFGLYEDVRPAFDACNELVEFNAGQRSYECDASFGQAFAPPVECPWHDRLPLHMAIYQGLLPLTKRILHCRPDLASEDAILLAFLRNYLDIVEFLLNERATMPELSRRVNFKISSNRSGGTLTRRLTNDA